MKLKKSEIQSAIATTIICVIILLVLIFCGMTAHKNEMDEGVMVSLGYAEEGFGESMPNPTPAPEAAPVPTPTPPPATPEVSKPSEEDLMTQEDSSVALEAEKKRKEAEEAARRKAEEERIARIKAEQEAKKNQASSLAGSAFQNKGKGQGQTKGETQQGNPVGEGSFGDHNVSIGRNLLGELAEPPYGGEAEGRIEVKIRVDASGKVLSAEIGQKTTIGNETLRNAAITAAKKNKFSAGDGVAIGTITYNFRLN